jgi:hypothetical protein
MRPNVVALVAGALTALATVLAIPAHADDVCGPGMNWDWRHEICQPGQPVPYPAYPYPTPPQQYPGYGY